MMIDRVMTSTPGDNNANSNCEDPDWRNQIIQGWRESRFNALQLIPGTVSQLLNHPGRYIVIQFNGNESRVVRSCTTDYSMPLHFHRVRRSLPNPFHIEVVLNLMSSHPSCLSLPFHSLVGIREWDGRVSPIKIKCDQKSYAGINCKQWRIYWILGRKKDRERGKRIC